MIKQLKSIFYLYKSFFIWSLLINLLFVLLQTPDIRLILIVKILLLLFTYYVLIKTNGNQKLMLYKILGISNFKLFASIYVIDLIFNILFFSLINFITV